MKIVAPKISKYIEEVSITSEMVQNDLVDLKICNQEVNFKICGIRFNGCIFENVDFSEMSFKDIELIDCVFEKCNLTGWEYCFS